MVLLVLWVPSSANTSGKSHLADLLFRYFGANASNRLHVAIKTYRYMPSPATAVQGARPRTMYHMRTSLTLNQAQVLIDDPAAPSRSKAPANTYLASHYRYTVSDMDASFEILLQRNLVTTTSSSSQNAPSSGWSGKQNDDRSWSPVFRFYFSSAI